MSVMGASLRFPVDPRDIPPAKAARRMGLSPAEFGEKLPALLARGFPRADPVTGNFDLRAIDAWMDARSGLTAPASQVQASALLRERIDAWKPEPGRRGRARAPQG